MPASLLVKPSPPTFLTHPPFEWSIGDDVADYVASCQLASGEMFAPDDNQRLLLRATFAGPAGVSYQTRDRKWFSSQVGIVACRQNLKTAAMEMAVVGAVWLLDARLVLWTANLYQPAAAESFLHFKELIEANPHLSRKVKRVLEGSGNQGVELMNGARIKFLARSQHSGRALSGDVVVLDEAYALTTAEAGALLPTRSARPNSQVWYGSSAGHINSSQLRLIRDRGRAGVPRLTYAEWCATQECADSACQHEVGTPGCALDDEAAWFQANPALGVRIDVDTVRDERIGMDPREFARERLGWWDEPKGGNVIPMSKWAPLGTSPGVIDGAACLWVDVTLDRSQSGIGLCGDAGGVSQVELAATGAGTDWVAETVDRMLSEYRVLAVGMRGAGPVLSLLPELKAVAEVHGVEFVKASSGDFAGMCGGFFDAVQVGSLRHFGDPRIDSALAAAKRHKVVDAWSWAREKVDVDAMPLMCVTGAHALWLRFSAADSPLTYDLAASFR